MLYKFLWVKFYFDLMPTFKKIATDIMGKPKKISINLVYSSYMTK